MDAVARSGDYVRSHWIGSLKTNVRSSTAEPILHETHSEWQQAVCKKDVNALWILFTEMAEAYLLKRAAGMTIQQDQSYKRAGKSYLQNIRGQNFSATPQSRCHAHTVSQDLEVCSQTFGFSSSGVQSQYLHSHKHGLSPSRMVALVVIVPG